MFHPAVIAALVCSVSAYPSKWFDANTQSCQAPAIGSTVMSSTVVAASSDATDVKFYKKGDATKAAVMELSTGNFIVEVTTSSLSLAYIPLGRAPLQTKIIGAQGESVGCQMAYTEGEVASAGKTYELQLVNANKNLQLYVYYANVYGAVTRVDIEIPVTAALPASPTTATAATCTAQGCTGNGACLLLDDQGMPEECEVNPAHFTSESVCTSDRGIWCSTDAAPSGAATPSASATPSAAAAPSAANEPSAAFGVAPVSMFTLVLLFVFVAAW